MTTLDPRKAAINAAENLILNRAALGLRPGTDELVDAVLDALSSLPAQAGNGFLTDGPADPDQYAAYVTQELKRPLAERLRLITHVGPYHLRNTPNEAADALSSIPGQGSKPEWRCFHCDEVFTDEHAARLHFGSDEGRVPACQIKGSEGGLVEALRRAIHNESTDAAKAYFAQNARHQEQLRAVEQTGYDRGIADAKAYPETLGLRSIAPSQPAAVGEADLLAKLRENISLELSWGPWDGEIESECLWRVHERRGNRNDQEWDLLGYGRTPADAIRCAIEAALRSTP